ncbi:MAG: protein translocase subunit SecD [Chloroflexi bacterium]|nr:protein translocase subunit SecD [Chloroflexota bacterium]
MRRSQTIGLLVIIAITAILAWAVAIPRIDLPLLGTDENGRPNRLIREGFSLGLDLRGGTYLTMEADLTRIGANERPEDALKGAMDIIQRRVNAYGISEAIVQRQPGGNRVIVQLPGVKNIKEAIDLIGKTAQLEFKEQKLDEKGEPAVDAQGNPEWTPSKGKDSAGNEVALTGAFLKRNAAVTLQPPTNQPVVDFEWNDEGATLFEQITTRLVNKRLGIFLDNELVSAPVVRAIIKQRGIIEGMTLREAELLSIQLNAGALPVPLKIIQQQDVDAILGADSLQKSLIAGQIGVASVILFMLLYYRLPGLVASLSLGVYGTIILAIFKLWPVTLSLAGIAAFILSLGMAVDANVLIFERMREELRAGRTAIAAAETGFRRAWPAIRDSNFTTIISAVILIWFGSRFGAVQVTGFAVVLLLGIVISMFSAIVVTRSFLRAFMITGLARKQAMFRK